MPTTVSQRPLVKMSGIGKRFGKVRVLSDVNLELNGGQVRGLVGENGAGKSTLMKILAGVYPVEEGTLEIDGRPISFSSPLQAQHAGVGMIFQEFSLIPSLTVAQNVMLRHEPHRGFLLNDRAARKRAVEIFAEMNVDVDVDAPMESLGTAYWQLTEIAKALAHDARVLIMDEPTSALTRAESDELFRLIMRLKDSSIGILYISHRMEEILQVCDAVTVLRDGEEILSKSSGGLTVDDLIQAVVGHSEHDTFAWTPHEVKSESIALEVSGLSTRSVKSVDLFVRPGEVLGIVGLVGSGRSGIARALFGIDAATSGTIRINDEVVRIQRPADAIKAGIGLIPEDRRKQGLILMHSVRDNLLLTALRRLTDIGFVRDHVLDDTATELMTKLEVRANDVNSPVRLLSGGNQQKVVIGKWLAMSPRILIMDEPTAGIDVGAKGDVIDTVRELTRDGVAVIMISSDLPELLALSDRIILMRSGAIVHTFARSEVEDDSHLQRIIQTYEAA